MHRILLPFTGEAISRRALDAALRLAVRAVGGPQALRGLRSFRYTASGNRWIYDEGFRPGEPA